MTGYEILTWLGLIFVADIAAMFVTKYVDYLRNRKPDLCCDGCGEVRKLYKVRGQKLYYCHRCLNRYKQDQKNGEITYVDN